MTEDRTPVDQALDLLVYAPLGLALSARDLIPRLAERGRAQWTSQVGMARLIGQFAVKQGTAEAEKTLARAREQALAKLTELGLLKDDDVEGPGVRPGQHGDDLRQRIRQAERAAANGDGAPASATDGLIATAPSEPTSPTTPTPATPPPTGGPDLDVRAPSSTPSLASALAIPDYDSLSASQVLPRLSGLMPAELEVVRAYEEAHRGRRTILNRITQLEAQ